MSLQTVYQNYKLHNWLKKKEIICLKEEVAMVYEYFAATVPKDKIVNTIVSMLQFAEQEVHSRIIRIFMENAEVIFRTKMGEKYALKVDKIVRQRGLRIRIKNKEEQFEREYYTRFENGVQQEVTYENCTWMIDDWYVMIDYINHSKEYVNQKEKIMVRHNFYTLDLNKEEQINRFICSLSREKLLSLHTVDFLVNMTKVDTSSPIFYIVHSLDAEINHVDIAKLLAKVKRCPAETLPPYFDEFLPIVYYEKQLAKEAIGLWKKEEITVLDLYTKIDNDNTWVYLLSERGAWFKITYESGLELLKKEEKITLYYWNVCNIKREENNKAIISTAIPKKPIVAYWCKDML